MCAEAAKGGSVASPNAAVQCPAGRYGLAGVTKAECTSDCNTGYYCPPGSSSPQPNKCGHDINGQNPTPNSVY